MQAELAVAKQQLQDALARFVSVEGRLFRTLFCKL
jgi:hypothetical protein